eukprot:scaffold116_cov334-Pavlova_lutheri.AAC.32
MHPGLKAPQAALNLGNKAGSQGHFACMRRTSSAVCKAEGIFCSSANAKWFGICTPPISVAYVLFCQDASAPGQATASMAGSERPLCLLDSNHAPRRKGHIARDGAAPMNGLPMLSLVTYSQWGAYFKPLSMKGFHCRNWMYPFSGVGPLSFAKVWPIEVWRAQFTPTLQVFGVGTGGLFLPLARHRKTVYKLPLSSKTRSTCATARHGPTPSGT